ncbi:hypothetical protein NF27_IB00020 [Candidatus Jidaibacter acanthamoeba]|uniref:Uncharacterized protein n=1 Tax=Candidatus Jidaibacter acanthamoebae TaxID=86105 RepID=A0A0C1QWK6_9RICK|nr:hypothetical protein [Candidatus Jidaibacter acanthamoeba]KIE04395.1 hypothetical protein NF27_IB00020 [Candidatus Jidaibacter acanthamoeba]
MNTREKLCKKIDNSRYLGKISKKVLKWIVMSLNNNQQVNYRHFDYLKSHSSYSSFIEGYSIQGLHSENSIVSSYSHQSPNIHLDIQNCGIQGNLYNPNNYNHL